MTTAPPLDLNQLKHLVSLAHTQSFTVAAERLGLTQSALSRSIQALEQTLGVQLVDRTGRRNELTPLGQVAFNRAQRVLFEIEELEAELRRRQDAGPGAITVGLGPFANALLSHTLIQHAIDRCPGLKLSIAVGGPEVLVPALRERRVDAIVLDPRALSSSGTSSGDLVLEQVTDLPTAFICRTGHPLTSGQAVAFEALLAYPIASSPFSPPAALSFMGQYGEHASPERLVSLQCQNWASMVETVRSTDAIHIGSFALAQALSRPGELVELPVLPRSTNIIKLALITLARRVQSPALAVFKDFVAARLAQVGTPGTA